jgi:hypothetical protein
LRGSGCFAPVKGAEEEFPSAGSLSSEADSGAILRLEASRSGLAANVAALRPAPMRKSRRLLFRMRLSLLLGGAEFLDAAVVVGVEDLRGLLVKGDAING